MFRLKELRIECGLKRSKLAADLNMNAGTIANYENEIRQASYENLIKFAEYFDVSIDYLLGRNDFEKPFIAQALTVEEKMLLADFQSLGKVAKSRVFEFIELWKNQK